MANVDLFSFLKAESLRSNQDSLNAKIAEFEKDKKELNEELERLKNQHSDLGSQKQEASKELMI